MLIMKLPHTEVKFYHEVKSQTGLSSLRVSCKRALIKGVLANETTVNYDTKTEVYITCARSVKKGSPCERIGTRSSRSQTSN